MLTSVIVLALVAGGLVQAAEAASNTTPSPVCLEPVDTGPCDAVFPKFFYNVTTNRCESFNYGGCNGTGNRFDDLEQCQETCIPYDTVVLVDEEKEMGEKKEEEDLEEKEDESCGSVQCLMNCPNGFEVDAKGCTVCHCRLATNDSRTDLSLDPKACPLIECPPCPGNTFVFDSNGCRTCDCIQPKETICPLTCMMFCEHGMQKDGNGCPLCKCNDPPTQTNGCPSLDDCDLTCDNGQQTDDNGCLICQCNNAVEETTSISCTGLMTCKMYCPNGYAKDSNGCPKCQCVWEEEEKSEKKGEKDEDCAPLVSCRIYCHEGYEKDSKGCDTCRCVDGIKEPVAATCPPVEISCRMACQFGFAKNAEGCRVCQCQANPCEGFDCPLGEKCISEENSEGEFKADCIVDETPKGCPLMKCIPCPDDMYMYDDYGCRTCECINPRKDGKEGKTSCPDLTATCTMFCPNGHQKNEEGCPICKCIDMPPVEPAAVNCSLRPMCAIFCPNGFMKDSSGCQICKCNDMEKAKTDAHCPPAKCKIFCEWGRVKNSDGCDICQCKDAPDEDPCEVLSCSEEETCVTETNGEGNLIAKCAPARRWCNHRAAVCRMFCENGFKYDQTGCPTCECLDHRLEKCPDSAWCRIRCKFGYQTDEHGCRKCECLPNPCQEMSCGMNYVCEAFVFRGCISCPAVPKCIATSEVRGLFVSFIYGHGFVRRLNLENLSEQITELLSQLLDTNSSSIHNLTVTPLSKFQTKVEFHLISYRLDLVQAARNLMSIIKDKPALVTFKINRETFEPQNESLNVLYYSTTEAEMLTAPSVESTGDDTVIIASCLLGLAFFATCAVIMFVLYRNRQRKHQGNIYKKAFTEDSPTFSQKKI